MKMTKEEFIGALIKEASKQNIAVSEDIADKMYQYKELLVEWNEKINLTTIIEDYDVIIKHIVDSLLTVKYIKEGDSVIDIGTGAGLPGLVISIFFEDKVKVTLLDSSNKKIEFLKYVVNQLNLKNIYTLTARAEEACHKRIYREQYDIAVARALSKVNILSELLSGYVKEKGMCIFMKAGEVEDELEYAKEAFNKTSLVIEKQDKYEIEYLKETLSRTVIIARKEGKLEDFYPRSFGKIKSKPL